MTKSLQGEAIMEDELDLAILDNLSMAGERFNGLLKMLSAGG